MNKNYHKECDEIIEEWSKFRRALRGEERDRYDDLVNMAKKHKTAGNRQDNPRAFETFLMSIVLEQEMKISRLERKLNEDGKDVDMY